mmetsp:Transcript_1351/g.2831  ORF Transcript_1351/g.2831 Transcript_1351/m.2831 type:complete len:377 (-) Transcript_1351:208-1338(-)
MGNIGSRGSSSSCSYNPLLKPGTHKCLPRGHSHQPIERYWFPGRTTVCVGLPLLLLFLAKDDVPLEIDREPPEQIDLLSVPQVLLLPRLWPKDHPGIAGKGFHDLSEGSFLDVPLSEEYSRPCLFFRTGFHRKEFFPEPLFLFEGSPGKNREESIGGGFEEIQFLDPRRGGTLRRRRRTVPTIDLYHAQDGIKHAACVSIGPQETKGPGGEFVPPPIRREKGIHQDVGLALPVHPHDGVEDVFFVTRRGFAAAATITVGRPSANTGMDAPGPGTQKGSLHEAQKASVREEAPRMEPKDQAEALPIAGIVFLVFSLFPEDRGGNRIGFLHQEEFQPVEQGPVVGDNGSERLLVQDAVPWPEELEGGNRVRKVVPVRG